MTPYIINMLRQMGDAEDRAAVDTGDRLHRCAAMLYRDWADQLEAGHSVADLPPTGRETVALIQEWAP